MSALVFTLFFLNLGMAPINKTDEARHGVNAYEMLQSNEYIMSTYRGEADLYNTKPPLSYWCIALSFKLLGYTKFALRFSSAASMFAAVMLCAIYAFKKYSLVAANIVLLLSAACTAYYDLHFGRAADADAIFVLMTVIFTLALIESVKRPFFLYICGISFALAFLAKSWHAANIAIVAILFVTIFRMWKNISLKQYIIAFACAFVPIFAWGIARFSIDGFAFFQNMITYDLLSRTTTVLEGHRGGSTYYIDYMLYNAPWALFAVAFIALALGGVLASKSKTSQVSLPADVVAFSLCIFVPLIVYSLAATKLHWYIYMVFPAFILLAAKSIHYMCSLPFDSFFKKAVTACVICIPLFLTLRLAILNIRLVNTSHVEEGELAIFATVERTPEFDHMPAFLQSRSGDVGWTQDRILAGQLAGNLLLLDGGIDAFTQHPSPAIIFVSKNIYDVTSQYFEGLSITQGPADPQDANLFYYMIKK